MAVEHAFCYFCLLDNDKPLKPSTGLCSVTSAKCTAADGGFPARRGASVFIPGAVPGATGCHLRDEVSGPGTGAGDPRGPRIVPQFHSVGQDEVSGAGTGAGDPRGPIVVPQAHSVGQSLGSLGKLLREKFIAILGPQRADFLAVDGKSDWEKVRYKLDQGRQALDTLLAEADAELRDQLGAPRQFSREDISVDAAMRAFSDPSRPLQQKQIFLEYMQTAQEVLNTALNVDPSQRTVYHVAYHSTAVDC